jgi:NADH dehydrogenase (ubiquinone) Fe-S protein 3
MYLNNLNEFINLTKLIPILTYQKINSEFTLIFFYSNIFVASKFLKQYIGFQYKLLSCISAIDLLDENNRFSIIYELLSITYNSRLRIKTFLENDTILVSSVVQLFINANWWEREIWDLFGLYFDKHPDLRRILTDYGFEGYAMRKDFPLSGFVEVRFEEKKKRVSIEPLEFSQEFRTSTSGLSW